MAKQTPPKSQPDDDIPPWERPVSEAAPATTGPGEGDVVDVGQAGDDTPTPAGTGWAADDEPEVPEVDPRFRREQLARQAGQEAQARPGFTIVEGGPATTLLLRALESQARTIDDGNASVYEDIFGRIQAAQSAEALFADDEPLDAEEIMGQALQVWDISVIKSDFAEGLRWYVAIRGRLIAADEDVVVTCGATKVVAQLVQAKAMKLFPVVVKFVRKERATRAGMHPLSMVLVK